MSEWALKSATELVRAIKTKEISAAELLDIYIDRVERLNPDLNAVVATDYEQARKKAALADKALANGEDWGALHGLPMTIKDNLEVEGMTCTAGAPALKQHMPAKNAHLVQRLLDQGAVIFGKTNLPRYGEDMQTDNEVYGRTNNPWDLSRTPGGSSGGAAAAVAAGLTGLEIGNDIGGSIRNPAHFCGIYGHKSTYGIVPSKGGIPPLPGIFPGDQNMKTDIVVNGPLARSAEDLDLAMGIIAAPEKPESIAWQIRLPDPRKKSLSEYRIGLWLDDPVCPVDSQVGSCLQDAADALAKAGARVTEKRPDIEFSQALEMYSDLLNGVMGLGVSPDMFEEWISQEASLQNPPVDSRERFVRGAIQRHKSWLLRDAERQIMRHKWADFFKEFDALLCPTAQVAAFPHDPRPFHERTIEVNGSQRSYTDLLGWAGLTNSVLLPATIAPAGLTDDGLPVGVQIVGPYLEDRTPIHIAALMAQVAGRFQPPKGYAA